MQKKAGDPPQYPIGSVGNVLRLLLLFRQQEEVRLSRTARELGIANSTAHRLLAMLQHHGFVRQDETTKAYRAGPALIEVALSVVRSMDLRRIARPALEELAEVTGETISLAVLEGDRVRYLDAVESDKALRVGSRAGTVLPAYCTSIGKALLAHLNDEELMALYPRERLAPVTDRSVTSRAHLLRQLDAVRQRGYAVNDGESEEGVMSVAVAIRDPSMRPTAAVSCAAPSNRLASTDLSVIANQLTSRAGDIAALLVR